MQPSELVCALACCCLGDDPTPYYVVRGRARARARVRIFTQQAKSVTGCDRVGTGLCQANETEPKTGRLLVVAYADGKEGSSREAAAAGWRVRAADMLRVGSYGPGAGTRMLLIAELRWGATGVAVAAVTAASWEP
ncbi:hypothetical protein HaLaN_29248 [Haematococcus lacustris]|uniref:Uncharacterized protein n=1 Tax=Haematococcus lacustris TaxID=44745 RepID=A0A6A0ACH8_HAELA|nr:hypothetical protein HaLaN_29248 [Haematococcus lacustris]